MSDALVPSPWAALLEPATSTPSWRLLHDFLTNERAAHQVFPPSSEVFTALRLTPPSRVRVVLLGQDPYHGEGQAHGLAFSVPAGVKAPPSLRNMFKELRDDLGQPTPAHGDLSSWASQGVLLLNTVLTVRAGEANSHQKRGWEPFTDALIRGLAGRAQPLVFVLWGNAARKKRRLIDAPHHEVLEGVHPSPLSAHRGFFGSRPFSAINAALERLGHPSIDWSLPSNP
ncbi:MAG: uracil-DNA glycosylase [Nannocystaceae bacterium]